MPTAALRAPMIRGIHGLLYSSDPDATRAFFRDVVRLPGSDIGEGWWIFDVREGDLGVHPLEAASDAGRHDVSLYCDDLEGTVAELQARGARFSAGIEDHGYGLVTYIDAPGGVRVQLYQPRYTKGTAAARARPAKAKRAAGGSRSGEPRSPPKGQGRKPSARRTRR